MMAELCYHIIDIVQNSTAANASHIEVLVEDSESKDHIILEIKDNGRGMNATTLENVQNPFYTTKSDKKVGLGIPLLKQAAQHCDGEFLMESQPGIGTRVFAQFKKNHIDTPPLGDINDTIFTTIVGTENIDITFSYITDKGDFHISTHEIKEQVGDDVPLTYPEIMAFLRQYIQENIAAL